MVLRYEPGGFAQGEGPVELSRGKSKDLVAVCRRHGEDEIGIGCDPRRELSCGEVGNIAAEVLQDARSKGLNRLPGHGVGTSTRCCEVCEVGSSTVRDGESFRRRRTTNVSSADEQYVQSKLLL